MMNRKQSLRDHPMIMCPKNTQTIVKGTPPAEAWFQQSCCCAPLLKSHFGMGAPAPCRFGAHAPEHSLNEKPPRCSLQCIYNTLIVNVRNLYFMWQNPVAVFKNTLVYWYKQSRRWVSFYWKKLAAVLSSIIFSLALCLISKKLLISLSFFEKQLSKELDL